MIAAAVSLALLSGLWPHHHGPTAPAQHARVGDWTYEVGIDRFTGEKACKLAGHDRHSGLKMVYFNGVVGVHFPHRVETSAAAFRVDGGAPSATLDQQFGNRGWVFVPAASLAGAREALIRPDPKAAPKAVQFAGLDQALASAAGQGCAPASFAQPDLSE